MNYIIYKTTNLVNGKFYVGQHNTSADDGYVGSGKYLKRAVNKYGKENFVRETIEFCNSMNVNEREVYWIDKLESRNSKVGYNIAKGGEGNGGCKGFGPDNPNFGNRWSDEQRKSLSEKIKADKRYVGENNPNFGNGDKIRGDRNPAKQKEAREKISKFWKGRKRSKEFCQNISERMRGRVKSVEERTNSSKWNYIFTNVKTGEVLETDALNLFCEEMGWKKNSINESVCRGRNKYKCWKIERSLKEDLL